MMGSGKQGGEDSVRIALGDLLAEEEQRQEEAEQARIEAKRLAAIERQEEEQRRLEEEEVRRREEEDARRRSAKEQQQREDRQRQAEEERRYRIRVQAELEARTRADEAGRLHELELARMPARRIKAPAVLWAMAGVVLLAGSGFYWWYVRSLDDVRTHSATELATCRMETESTRSDLSQAQTDLQSARTRIEQAEARLQAASTVRTSPGEARPDNRSRPGSSKSRRRRSAKKNAKQGTDFWSTGKLDDDPLAAR